MHALVFDLDGTLVDTVYAHVIAWQAALGEAGVDVDGYRLHRHVGLEWRTYRPLRPSAKPVASCRQNK